MFQSSVPAFQTQQTTATPLQRASDAELPQCPSDAVSCVRWSPTSNLLSAASWDRSVASASLVLAFSWLNNNAARFALARTRVCAVENLGSDRARSNFNKVWQRNRRAHHVFWLGWRKSWAPVSRFFFFLSSVRWPLSVVCRVNRTARKLLLRTPTAKWISSIWRRKRWHKLDRSNRCRRVPWCRFRVVAFDVGFRRSPLAAASSRFASVPFHQRDELCRFCWLGLNATVSLNYILFACFACEFDSERSLAQLLGLSPIDAGVVGQHAGTSFFNRCEVSSVFFDLCVSFSIFRMEKYRECSYLVEIEDELSFCAYCCCCIRSVIRCSSVPTVRATSQRSRSRHQTNRSR